MLFYVFLTIINYIVKKRGGFLPKSYSTYEREYIQKRLKEEAANCLAQYGIRRTTVDELVKRVKIPKGTFYLFYQSKELLLFDVIIEQHLLLEQELFQALHALKLTALTAEELTNVLLKFYLKAIDLPVLKLMNSEEMEILARKLPPEKLVEHMGQDHHMMEMLFDIIKCKPKISIETLSTAFRTLFLTVLQRDEIGREHFEDALRILIYGLVTQMI